MESADSEVLKKLGEAIAPDEVTREIREIRGVRGVLHHAAEKAAVDGSAQEELFKRRDKREHRKIFDKNVFSLLRWQVFFLCLVILLQGFGSKLGFFSLHDWVLGIFANSCLLYTFAILRYVAADLFNGK